MTIDPSTPTPDGSKQNGTTIGIVAVAIVVVLLVVGAVVFGGGDDGLVETIAAKPDLVSTTVATTVSPSTTTTTTAPTTTTMPATTTSTTSTTSTTAAPTTTALPTTAAPPESTLPFVPIEPMYRFAQLEDGVFRRFDPCGNPIKIRLNPSSYVAGDYLAELETFLTEQAATLSQLTGMTIEYEGLTDQLPSPDEYRSGEFILIHIGAIGEGILDEDKVVSTTLSWDREQDGFGEVDSFEMTVNAELFTEETSFVESNRWFLMSLLGNALGLDVLDDDDYVPLGVQASQRPVEIMDYGGATYITEWGEGDKEGLVALGSAAGCF